MSEIIEDVLPYLGDVSPETKIRMLLAAAEQRKIPPAQIDTISNRDPEVTISNIHNLMRVHHERAIRNRLRKGTGLVHMRARNVQLQDIKQLPVPTGLEVPRFKYRLISRDRTPFALVHGTDRDHTSRTDWHLAITEEAAKIQYGLSHFGPEQFTYASPVPANFNKPIDSHSTMLIYSAEALQVLEPQVEDPLEIGSYGFNVFTVTSPLRALIAVVEGR